MLDTMLFKEYTTQEARMFNPLQLALIGDGVYEVYVRNYVFNKNQGLSAHKIHVEAINYVKAQGQSDIMKILEPILTEDEIYIFKRGRNTKSATVPKNANVRDYRAATGMEALIGYLYLTNQQERLRELIAKGISELVR
ncbi:ribonuclease III domain-containing protein [uncultured Clostridium sp.]|jgi:ribonuclease-3 family protein|uniref:Mini-ribonuclease 3 n=1 Tax=uncultured Clostridium sp. TaxID=59620 RepID=UPI002605F984|nr:ribonuclease III domain-containing protein [uncultured Clostridium sp.]